MRPALPTGGYILGSSPNGSQAKAVIYTGSTPCECCGGTPTTCCCDPYGTGTGSGYEYGQPDYTHLTISEDGSSGSPIDWLSGTYKLANLGVSPCGLWQYIGNVANLSAYCAYADTTGFPNGGTPTMLLQVGCGTSLSPSCNNIGIYFEFDGLFGGFIGPIFPQMLPPCSCNPLFALYRFTLPQRLPVISWPCPSDPSLLDPTATITYNAQWTL